MSPILISTAWVHTGYDWKNAKESSKLEDVRETDLGFIFRFMSRSQRISQTQSTICPQVTLVQLQSSLTYPNPTYPDYSLIQTHVWFIYKESDSLIQIHVFRYPECQFGNEWISEGPLYMYLQSLYFKWILWAGYFFVYKGKETLLSQSKDLNTLPAFKGNFSIL